MKYELICKAGDCYNENGNNDYSALNSLKESRGVFVYAADTDILYIGESTKGSSKWSLNDRVSQGLDRSDSGCPFKDLSDDDYFSKVLESSIYAYEMNDASDDEIIIKRDEAIEHLKPLYNKRKSKEEDL